MNEEEKEKEKQNKNAMSASSSSPQKSSNKLLNVALLSHVIKFAATSVKRTTQLSFLNSTWSDCIANYSSLAWERLFESEPSTATRVAMRACNLGLFEIARVVAGNPSAAKLRDSSNWSCLHQASFCGRPGTCSLLLQMEETDIFAQTLSGWSPVRCAVYNSNSSVMKVLCSSSSSMDTTIKLLNLCCNEGDSPLLACVAAGLDSRIKMIDVMLSPFLENKKVDDHEELKKIVNYFNPKTGLSPLFVALRNRDTACAELLIKKYGADIDARDPIQKRTALLFVASAPEAVSVPMMKLLFDNGAKICCHKKETEELVRDGLGNSIFELVGRTKQKAREVVDEEAKRRGIKVEE